MNPIEPHPGDQGAGVSPSPCRLKKFWCAYAHCGFVALIIAAGLLLRAWNLGNRWMQPDEAESGINSLTILEHGIPMGTYLGLPIYENTLVNPWPGNIEYEFKDSSYNDRGVAIYHGWLPLYAMAASFKVAGIHPDAVGNRPQVLHSGQVMRARARAARLPSVFFAAIFLAAVYIAGRVMSGPTAGVSALIIAAFAPPCIEYGRQARYYSAAAAFGTLGFLALWQVVRRGTWRSYALWTAALLLLFFSYMVTFGAALLMWALVSPWSLRARGAIGKSMASVAVLVCVLLPWLLWTGAFHHHTGIPPARSLMKFPQDYTLYFAGHGAMALVLLAAMLGLGIAALGVARLPRRIAFAFENRFFPAGFALGSIVIGFVTFVLVIPASSLFLGRVKLAGVGPMIVFAGIMVEAAARIMTPGRVAWAPVLLLVVMPIATARATHAIISPLPQPEPGFRFVEDFKNLKVEPGTKIYSIPLENLPLSFMSGLPVQSIAPVRKSFLDNYPGRILLIDPLPRTPEQIRNARLAPDKDGLWQNPAIFRGFEAYTLNDFWTTFFYRFVNPASRVGPLANYAARIQGANKLNLPCGWVLYDCPPKAAGANATESDRG